MREMRRKDKAVSLEEAKEILNKYDVGTLSTVDEEGQPYGIPVNYVYMEDKIYFHCALEGYKLDNIKANNKVCFSVFGGNEIIPQRFTTTYESVLVFGKAEVADEAEKLEALKYIIERLSPGFEKEGIEYITKSSNATLVVKINIEGISGKKGNRPKHI